MRYVLSEWGKTIEFDTYKEALDEMDLKDLTDGEQGILRLFGDSYEDMFKWRVQNEHLINFESMILSYIEGDVEFEWDDVTGNYYPSDMDVEDMGLDDREDSKELQLINKTRIRNKKINTILK